MNVSLSIVVFLLLVSKILPPTSSSIPLVRLAIAFQVYSQLRLPNTCC